MKKKNLIGLFLIVVAIITVNITTNLNSQTSDLSLLSLANVEALAFPNESGKGAKSALVTDLGNDLICVNDMYYSRNKFRIDCFGEGNLACSSGEYESLKSTGARCILVR